MTPLSLQPPSAPRWVFIPQGRHRGQSPYVTGSQRKCCPCLVRWLSLLGVRHLPQHRITSLRESFPSSVIFHLICCHTEAEMPQSLNTCYFPLCSVMFQVFSIESQSQAVLPVQAVSSSSALTTPLALITHSSILYQVMKATTTVGT